MDSLDEMKPKLEKLKETKEELESISETDHESITDELDDLKDKYERVEKNADENLANLQTLKGVLKQLKDSTEPVEELFTKVEEKLDEHPQLETDEKKIEKEIEKIEVSFCSNYPFLPKRDRPTKPIL